MKRRLRETLVVGGIACALAGASAPGAVLYTQDYENLVLGNLAGQDGYTAMPQARIVEGGLDYDMGDVRIAGGDRRLTFTGLTPANNWVFSRTFPAQSGTVYFALAMTWTEQVGDDMLLFALSNDADTSPVALGNSAGVNINPNGTQIAGLINGRIRRNATTETTATSSGKGGGATTLSTQFIVGSLSKVSSENYNTLRLWVNPTSFTEGAPDVTVSRDVGIASGLDTFFFFSGASNESNETLDVDNLRIGTTWADVMPSPPRPTMLIINGEPDSVDPPAPLAYSELTDDGAYCWFADPRALHFRSENGTQDRSFIGWVNRAGDIMALQYDHKTNQRTNVVIHKTFERDDHDNPTFLVLPDERIMIFYSRHSNEKKLWYRVSTNPGDITSLSDAKFLDTDHNTTYPSPFILSDDPDSIYLAWRGINWHPTLAKIEMPTVQNGLTTQFLVGPHQILHSSAQETGCRPYAKYTSDGKSRIYLAFTATHPDNITPTLLYGGYVDITDLSFHSLDGNVLDQDLTSAPLFTVRNNETFDSANGWLLANDPQIRHWVWETALGEDGAFHVLFTKISSAKTKHEYYYGRWYDGGWSVLKLADAGGWFHQNPSTEKCYSAGMAFDSADPCVVYASVPVDGIYEIVRITLASDASRILTTEAVTEHSEKNNVRPYVIDGSLPSDGFRLFWMHGDYFYWKVVNPAAVNDGYYTGIRTDFIFPEN